jgi:hypothetical protein
LYKRNEETKIAKDTRGASEMNMLLFCTLFIFQYVGHRIGDYLIQSNTDARKKSTSFNHRLRHCAMYSITILLLMFFIVDPMIAFCIWAITFIEHMCIDSRTPIVWWKTFFEQKIMGDKSFDIEELPFFVLIDIDQTFHLVRIFIISLVLSYIL